MTSTREGDETEQLPKVIVPKTHVAKAGFDLLTDADEESLRSAAGLEAAESQKENIQNPSPKKCIQSSPLRSISLPKGPSSNEYSPMQQSASTTCQENEEKGNSSLPVGISQVLEAKKAKKEVTDYYKKQNELLENFKNDSEQIQVFQKTRTRQRLNSSTSECNDPPAASVPKAATSVHSVNEEELGNGKTSDVTAPLLKHVDGDDEPVVVRPSSNSSVCAEQTLLAPGSRKDLRSETHRSHDSVMARHEAQADKEAATSRAAQRFAYITIFVNVTLMIIKLVATLLSGSVSVMASLADSIVDIASGVVISISARLIKKRDPYSYPRGRTRLEPLSLIIISVIMGTASIQLIVEGIMKSHTAYLYYNKGEGTEPDLVMELPSVAIMVATVVIKLILFIICQGYKSDPNIDVLAMDHRNDCISNSVALACAWLAQRYWYYLDPIGGILVSLYISFTWLRTGWGQITKLSGKSAQPEFINRIIKVCIDHDSRIQALDTVYVYHYGTKFLVEVHIVLDETMPLREAHDISEALQNNIESLPDVERAFVHTDYEFEHHPQEEHKVV